MMRRGTREFVEDPNQMKFAHPRYAGDLVQVQRHIQMALHMADNPLNANLVRFGGIGSMGGRRW
jgi:hypothetical protein